MSAPLQIGLVLFPRVTQLDFTGPLQVFSSVPGAQVHLIWKRIEPVASDSVMAPEGLTPRASISAPDELRTGPGVTANVLIASGAPATRAAISNADIGPAASSN